MDWFVDPKDRFAAAALRRQIGAYLRRHATRPGDADDAELAVEELLGNAVRHTDGPVWIAIDWSGRQAQLTIYDLGAGFDIDTDLPETFSEGGRGLFLAAHLTSALSRANRRAGGNKLTATLRVERPAEPSFAPPRNTVGALPSQREADPAGGFSKETFLRALVVQLAQVVEDQHGPNVAHAAVAQVGTDVGGQMEQEYRAAADIADRLTPDQMAQCYVRLKAAIGGDFYVIEATPERIVLGNRACPFGSIVQRSPALCRMTSSVFGGIAARNGDGDGATVTLEERIAVGDPECRVVVELGQRAATDGPGHYYPPPTLETV